MATPKTYANDSIAVLWDSTRCIHTARCLRALPEVFDVGRRPWIDVEAATASEIAAAVERCPTGALRYERRDGGPAERPQRPTQVRAVPDGPLALSGDVRVEGPDGEPLAHETRLTLCRCGLTRNQPFCDNSHRAAGWRSGPAHEPARELPAPDPDATRGPTRVVAMQDKSLQLTGALRIWTSTSRKPIPAGRAVLCRCGHSGNKPFCDGSHARVGFKSQTGAPPAARLEADTPAGFAANPAVPEPQGTSSGP